MGNRIDITLNRVLKFEDSTIGVLTFDKKKLFTLEPRHRNYDKGEKKIKGESAIPHGTYLLTPYNSPCFGQQVPLLMEVPGFDCIEIHKGNYVCDTRGCILVGRNLDVSQGHPYIGLSSLALNDLMSTLKPIWKRGDDVWLTIDDSHLVDATTV